MTRSKSTVDHRKIADFFSTPSLLSSEHRSEFDALFQLVQAEFPPQNFLEQIRNRRIVDALWDIRRAQHLTAGVIDSGRIEALALQLAPVLPDKKQATAVAQAYLEGGDKSEKVGSKFVDKLLLSTHELIGRAFATRQASIGVLEKMRVNRERSLMQALEGVAPQAVAKREQRVTRSGIAPAVSPPRGILKGGLDVLSRQVTKAGAVSDEEELELPDADEDKTPQEDELLEEEITELDDRKEDIDLGKFLLKPKVHTSKRQVSTAVKSRLHGRGR